MDLGIVAAVSAAGYLIGSISVARIIGRRALPGEDLEQPTSMEFAGGATVELNRVGATDIGARAGPKWGGLVSLIDMVKAFAPTLATRLIWPDDDYHLIMAVAVMLGHIYSVFHRFKGGRGQSCLYGGLLAVDWLALPVTTIAAIAIGRFVVRDMTFSFVGGQLLLLPWFAWRGGWPEVAYAIAINVVFTIATLPEIRGYVSKWRAGEMRRITTWGEFRVSHPGMGSGRFDAPQDTDP